MGSDLSMAKSDPGAGVEQRKAAALALASSQAGECQFGSRKKEEVELSDAPGVSSSFFFLGRFIYSLVWLNH